MRTTICTRQTHTQTHTHAQMYNFLVHYIILCITRPRDPNIPTTVNGLYYYYYHHHLSPRGCVYCSGGGRQQNRIAHPAAPHSDVHTSGMFANPNEFFRPFCRSRPIFYNYNIVAISYERTNSRAQRASASRCIQ